MQNSFACTEKKKKLNKPNQGSPENEVGRRHTEQQ